ncbi:3-hydroxyacyl-CoA dehydrogenase family protein (plasmid) [Natronorubrum aibiense]|uniref:3-hydroxyacyl-CoA dehydrogenase family protein n=2 Tax=Natronorubrum aibiense TaxID=348826 RepID=A0A5P9P9N9_9EURY|nr:3-hydroxyacyl-CoA dehydrogenase family protein [Natronorubrum aibiense]
MPSATSVATIGAGTMGHGIAFAAAAGGCPVSLFDVDDASLEEARAKIRATAAAVADSGAYEFETVSELTDRIEYVTALEDAVDGADLVIEAVPEDREIKLATFERIDRHVDDDTVVATNTSSLPLDDLVEPITAPERFCGMHWFHPPHIVPVVEVVYGDATTADTIDTASQFLREIGKDPVVVERDVPGFIANRIQSAMAREAWALLEAGVASPADIDRAIKGTFGFRLPLLGAFEKGDHSGLDIHHTVLEELLPEIDRSTSPPPVLSDLVEEGRYGAKTGRGVYDWRDADLERISEERDRLLLEQLEVYRAARGPPSTDRA